MSLRSLATLLLATASLSHPSRAQDAAAGVPTVWPAVGLNGPGDELAPVHLAGGGLAFLRVGGASQTRRERRWSRRWGRPPADLRYAAPEADGRLLELGDHPLFPAASGLEGPLALSADTLQAYLSLARPPDGARGRRARRNRRERLFAADRGATAFGTPVELPFVDPSSRTLHPALSPDGLTLVFASDRDGGYGGLDLWAVRHDGDLLWGEPRNLGAAVNSREDDAFPAWHPDGDLYFASRRPRRGRHAVGDSTVAPPPDYDLFVARAGGASGAGFDGPRRLAAPLSGPGDDVSIAFDSTGRAGLLASSRPGGAGGLDLYHFALGPRVLLGPAQRARMTAVDAATGEGVPQATFAYVNASAVTLAGALRDSLLGVDGEVAVERGARVRADDAGALTLHLNPGRYFAGLGAPGYDTRDTTFAVSTAPIDLTVALRPSLPCSPVAIAVLDAASLEPVVGAAVSYEGALGAAGGEAGAVVIGEGGSARACLPCGSLYGLLAVAPDGARSLPSALDLRGGEECADGTRQVSLTMYIRRGEGAARRPLSGAPTTPRDPRGPGAASPAPTGLASGPAAFAEEPTIIALPSVRYDYGSANLGKEARSDLGHLAEVMSERAGMRVVLGSHTDSRGSRAFNAKLSGRRAAEAARYLTRELGVPAERVRAVGYGESQLLNGCRDGVPCGEPEHRANRRTEIAVTGVDDPGAIAEALARRAAEAEAEGYVNAPPASTPIAPAEYTPPPRYEADYVADPARTYWVVAGTFRRDGNAERRRGEFERLGYAGIEVVRFDGSGRRAVVVGKFGTLTEARQFARAVAEAHRIAAYVRRVR